MGDDDQLATLLARIAAGTMRYEDAADLFALSTVGQATGVTRPELLARLRQRFQDETALNAFLRLSYAQSGAAAFVRSRAC